MPAQSALWLRSVCFWFGFALWYVAEKRLDLLFTWTSWDFVGDCDMPEKIVGINLSTAEYALVSEEP